MTISVIGLGLIGGSIALDLSRQMAVQVIGVEIHPKHEHQALDLGIVDTILPMQEAVSQSDIIVLATPVNTVETLLPQVLDLMQSHQTLIDVGSTKEAICTAVAKHPMRHRFVAAHPLAGTEYSGPTAAESGLFNGHKNIICHRELSDEDAVTTTEDLFRSLGMNTYYMSAQEHDKHLAYVSHLSHVTSFTLGLTVLDIEKDEKQLFNLASTGFASTARLAKSNPETWAAIFTKNDQHLVDALDQYIDKLVAFKTAIQKGDDQSLLEMMKTANQIQKFI